MDSKITIPKTVYDKEYSTQWKREVKFLEEKGIAYVYAKRHPKYPVTRYKYTKTPELFLALTEFYNQVRNEETFRKIEEATKKLPLEEGCINIPVSELTDPEKKLMDITVEDVERVLDDTE